ncbi:MAG: hypothetical protein HY040_14530 [Planctomycetes bacterium]|nr:hypothetical protein [Planctomycetota bacterium]
MGLVRILLVASFTFTGPAGEEQAKDAPKKPDSLKLPSPKKPAPEIGEAEKTFVGIWTGVHSGKLRIVLEVKKLDEKWNVEAYFLSAAGKQVSQFKQPEAALSNNEIRIQPKWTNRPPNIHPATSYVLVVRSNVMQLEAWFGKKRVGATDLKPGDKKLLPQAAG